MPRSKKAIVKVRGRAKLTAHYVHVVSAVIRKNRLLVPADREPPVVVRRGRSGRATRSRAVDILDENGNVAATVRYTPERPLGCGAVVYVEAPYGARPVKTEQ
jgi:hypothetical protein